MHIYWQAGNNSRSPGEYSFSYWDATQEEWITPNAWIANESQQGFRTQYVFTLNQPVSTNAVRLFRASGGNGAGI